ncbi:C25 family cysteine peptidase [Candidatus Marinimicrobia bacterium]|nr:C25 family cysteine peptidase [Candidatus Neomarinimicrobiota bacterium]
MKTKNLIYFLSFFCLSSFNFSKEQSNFSIISSTSLKTEISFKVSAPSINKNNSLHEFEIDELVGRTMDEGSPQLPTYSTLFKINPAKKYDITYEIIDSYSIQDINFKNYKSINSNSTSIYPLENMYVSDPEIMRDIVLHQIGFIPYKYFPDEKRLEVYSEVKINISENGESDNNYTLPQKKSRVFEELYRNSIINHNPSNRSEDYQTPSILYICGGSSCNNNYFQDLVLWRHKQGYEVTVIPTSESGNSESAINNFISNAYYTWVNPPEIIGLVGDVGGSYNIACDYYDWGQGWYGYSGASDVKYTYIAGNDLLPEVVIGRISADNSSDLNNIINKTIQYEKAQLQTDLGWFERAALIGDPSASGLSCAITNQWIKELMIQYGFEDVAADLNGGGSQLENFLNDNFNEGIMYYNYRGIQSSPGSYVPNNGNNLSNGYYTPFATVLTCGTGDFNQDDDSEAFIRVGSVTTPKGAVACVGTATTGTHTAYNNIINMGIYDGIFAKNVSFAGSATTSGRLAIYETYPANPGDCVGAFSAWNNLMGDPALHLWTDTPQDFNVSIPTQIPLGTNHLELVVINSDGAAVENARVTLLMGDDIIFESNYTDINGNVIFDWNNTDEAGTLYVTVTKRNYRPLENSISILDDYAIDMQWDGDLESNSGQNYIFPTISISSVGNENISWIQGELTSNSDLVDITNPTTSWIYMSPDDSIGNQEPLIIHISENAIFGDNLSLILNLVDDEDNTWSIYLPFQVNSPKIDIGEFLFSEDINPGSTVDAYIQLENTGNLDGSNISIEVTSSSHLINIQNNNINFGDIEQNTIAISDEPITLIFNNTILNGTILPIEVNITDDNGYNRSNFINLTVGQVTTQDPLGPNQYGYYIYDIYDVDYDLKPVFDWIEIDPQYGGNGTDLNLSDGGDGNNATNSTTIVDLPFTFNFYGDSYNNISINTNGWIAFGETELFSFRNYSLPGPGGPSPMLAAFWDDMKTSSSGDVFYQMFPEGCNTFPLQDECDYVVIEWSDMRTQDGNSEEDFQVILYAGNDTPTGDGEIKVQYKEFNNTSNGYYPEGGRPEHGCYVTIGIENKYSNEGLEYTFNNVYAPGAATLSDRSAIFITTQSPYLFYGDLNSDETLNVLDIVLLVGMVLGTNEIDLLGDMNQDEILNVLDIVILVSLILDN